MTVEEFLSARLDEAKDDLLARSDDNYILIDTLRMVLTYHMNWPVMLEKPIEFETEFEAKSDYFNSIVSRMSRQLEFVTREEYTKRFGEEAPTSPIVRSWLEKYQDHPDFNKEWLR